MPTPTSVLIICQLFYPELTTGQTVTELAQAITQEQIHTTVWCAQPTLQPNAPKLSTKDTYQQIQITRLWSTRFPKLNLLGKLINHLTFTLSASIKLWRDTGTSPIIVFTNPPFLAHIISIIAKQKKRPLVYVLFDLYPDTAIACQLISPTNPIAKIWQKLNLMAYTNATHIIVLGRCMHAYLTHQLPKVLHHKINIVPVWANSALLNTPRPEHPISRDKYHLHQKFVLLYSGNLGRFHDIETFANAALELTESHPEITWLFVGDGYKKKWLQNFIRSHNLPSVHYHPFVPQCDLADLLASAHVGLVSLLPEQLGLSVPSKTYSLMAAKLPILAIMPDACETAKMIIETDSGFVIEANNIAQLKDAIITLYQDPDLRHQQGQNAQKAVIDKFTATHAARAYIALLSQ